MAERRRPGFRKPRSEPGEPVVPEDVLGQRYQLLESIGSGGYGLVHRANDRNLGRQVAVKILRPAVAEPSAAGELLARFRQEAWVTAGLRHPNVVTVHDAATDGDRVFIVMELLSGPSLAQLVDEQQQLPLGEVLRHGARVASVLEYIHGREIVHRDLKPANLVLDNGVVKVCDFGIAAVLAAEATRHTGPRRPPGTPHYMSPEHWNSQEATPGWDLFSLGAVLYCLLTGGPPFQARHATELARAISVEQPEPVRHYRPDVPPELEQLIFDLLAKQPGARPDAAEALAQLEALAGSRSAGGTLAADTGPGPGPDPRAAALVEEVTTAVTAEFAKVRLEYAGGRRLQAGLRLARLVQRARIALGPDHELVQELERYWTARA